MQEMFDTLFYKGKKKEEQGENHASIAVQFMPLKALEYTASLRVLRMYVWGLAYYVNICVPVDKKFSHAGC